MLSRQDWVVSGMSRAGNKARVEEGGELTDEPWKYAAFAARIDAGPDYFERMERLAKAKKKAETRAKERAAKEKGKGKARERSVGTDDDALLDFSRISYVVFLCYVICFPRVPALMSFMSASSHKIRSDKIYLSTTLVPTLNTEIVLDHLA